MIQKWEYMTQFNYSTIVKVETLNAFAADGWELISVVDIRQVEAANWQLFFKRPVTN